MPIYEYVCAACGAEVEVMHKISEKPGKCPKCKKDKLSKQISAAGFRLGGGGWYETDFKSGGDKKRNLAGGGDAAPASAPASTAADKPAAEKPAATAKPASTKSASTKAGD